MFWVCFNIFLEHVCLRAVSPALDLTQGTEMRPLTQDLKLFVGSYGMSFYVYTVEANSFSQIKCFKNQVWHVQEASAGT